MNRVFKNLTLMVIGFSFIISSLFGEGFIMNKEIKKTENIELKKEMKIKSEGRGYYLKYPVCLKTDKRGNIYMLDGSKWGMGFYEVIKFNEKGEFVKKLVHGGQGPGEAIGIDDYFIDDDKIYIHDLNLRKLMIKDLNGNLIKEFRLKRPKMNRKMGFYLISKYNKKLFFQLTLIDFSTRKTSIIDKNILFSTFENNKWKIGKTIFHVPIFFIRGSNGVTGLIPLGHYEIAIYKKKFIYVKTRGEYGIKLYDMENDRIIVEFGRKYKRVKKTVYDEEKKGGVMIGDKWYYEPHKKYYDDIQKLIVHNDKLWVMTSTTDENRGVLIDVFTDKGLYVSKFYLKLIYKTDYTKIGDISMNISGDFLYTIETDNDGGPVIIKYKIPDKDNI